ncbi:MAG: 4Fe-4S dicluster domain-containing protein [Christensenella sp.]|nr:4Fe-4S dicluster domain-containing protein [Christensenella sp.]
MSLIDNVKEAGIIGAGGAGFPTHVKIGCKAEYVIGNGAECEPLLRVDQQLMAKYAADVVKGIMAVKEQTGAKQAVICLKAHYHDAVAALEQAAKGIPDLEIRKLKSFYPAGDEQQMVFEVTGRVIPTGGLPLDVGAVVCNVSTLVNIANAIDGKPVTDKLVTVGAQVAHPMTLRVPIGTPISVLLTAAGAPEDMTDYTVVIGGPCMGKLTKNLDTPVTKTTGGLLVFHDGHPLLAKKCDNAEREIQLAKAVCCNCSMCTQMCPRNALGLHVQPHKAMRAIAQGESSLLGSANSVFSCCDCGLCTYFACNFGLSPSRMMQRLKSGMMAAGIKPVKEVPNAPDLEIKGKQVPVSRLMARLHITEYDVPAPLNDTLVKVRKVIIPLKMSIGAPSVPVVAKGDSVAAGDLIAEIKEGALGSRIHASIAGTVSAVTGESIEITMQ